MKNNDDSLSAAAKLISLGVVDEEAAAALLRHGFVLAARAANEGDSKEYRASVATMLSIARLVQDERHKLLDKVVPDAMLTLNGQAVSPEQLWQTMFSGKSAKTLEALPAPNGDQDEEELGNEG